MKWAIFHTKQIAGRLPYSGSSPATSPGGRGSSKSASLNKSGTLKAVSLIKGYEAL
jgi:hypothetical protein